MTAQKCLLATSLAYIHRYDECIKKLKKVVRSQIDSIAMPIRYTLKNTLLLKKNMQMFHTLSNSWSLWERDELFLTALCYLDYDFIRLCWAKLKALSLRDCI